MANKKLMRGLTAVTGSLLTISLGVTTMANTRSSFLNSRLGTTNYKQVTDESVTDAGDGLYFKSEFNSLSELAKSKENLAAELASEGAVLLKNEKNALPVSTVSEKITLWGMNSSMPITGGLIGSSVALAEGQKSYDLLNALTESGFQINQDFVDLYNSDALAQYRMKSSFFGQEVAGHALTPVFTPTYDTVPTYFVGEAPTSVYSDDLLKSADDTAAIVVISRDNSEAADYFTDMQSALEDDSFDRPLALSQNEKAMIDLAKQHSTKVIVLINADSPMELESLKEDADVDAVLWTGLPGMYGFKGVAQVISGEVNPSGSLPDTYATNSASSPAMVNMGIYLYTNSTVSENPALTAENKSDWYVVESEGIYTGYKYYETRYEDQILGQGNADATEGSSTGSAWNYEDEVTYPFGYGLSYTTFDMKLQDVELELSGEGTATVEVTNTGDIAGKTPVQLYVQSPYTEGGLEKSAIQLLDFAKTDILAPGESEIVTISFDPEYMASYDEDAKDGNGAWVLESGDYYFSVGNGAHEALNNVLLAKTGSNENLISVTDGEKATADNAKVWTLDADDTDTYSENVQNALQDADINNLIKNTVEYTTRADWAKGWTPVEEITPTEEMMKGLTNHAYALSENQDAEVKWNQDNGLVLADMIETDEEGNFTGVKDIDDPSWQALVEQMSLADALSYTEEGGDDLEDIPSISAPRTYMNDGPIGFVYDQVPGYFVKWNDSESNQPTYVSETDEGAANSMAGMPTEPVVAATFNKDLVEREGQMIGEDSLWSNTAAIIAPGMNLHRNPYNGRNHEYYSEDSMLTNRMGLAMSEGASAKGLMTTAKHFAFNHQESNRSGLSTFITEQAGRENELRGFQGMMEQNTTGAIMTAFNRIGTVYSGAYEGALLQISRNEWGYNGLFITDMINGSDYMNWKDVVLGSGGILLANNQEYSTTEWGGMQSRTNVKKIQADAHFQENLQKSMKYSLYATAKSNAMNGVTKATRNVYVRTWYQNLMIGLDAALILLTLLALFGYVKANRREGMIRVEKAEKGE